MSAILAIEDKYSSGLYTKHGLVFVKGEGARLWDHEGREYIDCMAGHGVANLGHTHPKLVEAVAAQASRLITCPEAYYNDRRAELLEKLGNLLPGLERVFLCNSGTEAVEAALKFARISTGRIKIIAAMRGFHGRTMGALSATWNRRYREPFEPLVPGFEHVPYNNIEALAELIDNDTAAVILEVVQGEGGVHVGEGAYLQAAQRLCQERGALLIIDEVQTGFGRTGKLVAAEHFNLKPDLLCLAKSIAGGLPMGAVLIGPRVENLSSGMHATTFGGNPLACAASLAAFEVMETEDLAGQAADNGAYLLDCLGEIQSPLIREVRGLGLMIGVEIKQKVAPYLRAMTQRRVIALPAGMTVVRLLPPLVISKEQLDRVVEVMAEVLG